MSSRWRTGIRRLKCLVMQGVWVVTFLLSEVALAQSDTRDRLNLGILAYRPAPVMEANYQPLVDFLSARSGLDVRLQILNQDDMNRALAANQVDVFFTNPSHYLLIRSERSLTGVLATAIRRREGEQTGSIGGVILAAANRDDLNELADIQNLSIATPGIFYMGGYQSQALELQTVGIDVQRSNRVLQVNNHDRVLRAVMSGDADIGFLRTGVFEEVLDDAPALADEFKIINAQQLKGYPFALSTRLYPEWPVVSLPHVDSRVIRRFSSALFALTADHPAAMAADLAGFSPPADYQSVENLARSLRLPPFDQVPRITWLDALHQYWIWVAAVVLLMVLLLVTTLLFFTQKRRIAGEEQRLRDLIARWPQPMLMLRDRTLMDCNQAAVELLHYQSDRALIGQGLSALSAPVQVGNLGSSEQLTRLLHRVEQGHLVSTEWHLVRADGEDTWVDMTLAPVVQPGSSEPGVLCAWYDITGRKHAEERARLAVRVFENAREAIFITDAYGVVVDVNDAYLQILDRTRAATIGQLPPLPTDEGSGALMAARREGSWAGEFSTRLPGGRVRVLHLTLSAVRSEQGELTHYVGIFSDISRLKESEEKLRTMAHYDALTGLPNRVLFSDRLTQAMAQAARQGYRLGILYIDLDNFKPVNDAFGHAAGDTLLVEVARRMKAVLREEDMLARLGGDEFAAIVVNLQDEPALEALLQRLLQVIAEPVWVANHDIEVSASIGYTLYPQTPEPGGDQLLRQADQAMYQAKQAGRNRFCAYQAPVV